MNFPRVPIPFRVLYEIREFSRPLSRPDWRTCKKAEAGLIHEHLRTQIKLELVVKPIGCGWNMVRKYMGEGGAGC